ncbi:hypothetical protein CSKR_107205 [Clonorchis sinensis]|uniref:Uncharacterized protein n=1 Tax=Clonorchis sinensis TaxID=79923 RepID=A0A3R7C5F2_CLOSI|nr:hypothetical protein CSKR_107205 [Clonorchis sinensis]
MKIYCNISNIAPTKTLGDLCATHSVGEYQKREVQKVVNSKRWMKNPPHSCGNFSEHPRGQPTTTDKHKNGTVVPLVDYSRAFLKDVLFQFELKMKLSDNLSGSRTSETPRKQCYENLSDRVRPFSVELFADLESIPIELIDNVQLYTLPVPNCHATRRKHEGWNTARLPKPRQSKSRCRGRVRTTDLPLLSTLYG